MRCQTADCPVTPCSNCVFPHLQTGPGTPHILKYYRTPKGSNCQLEVFLKRLQCREKYYDKIDKSVYTMKKMLSMSVQEVGQLCSYLGMTTKERCDVWNELQYIKVTTGLVRLEPDEARAVMAARGTNYPALEALCNVTQAGRAQPLLVGQNKQVEDLFDQIISET